MTGTRKARPIRLLFDESFWVNLNIVKVVMLIC